jgi:hypothetical protein
MIRQGEINPGNLHWEGFLMAEDAGIRGIHKVKVHEQGAPERSALFDASR